MAPAVQSPPILDPYNGTAGDGLEVFVDESEPIEVSINCMRKRRFTSLESALQSAEARRGRPGFGKKFHAYPCRECGGYHVGHKS